MARKRTRVLIAGAGPVGLAAGAELSRRGLDVRIIDKKPARTKLSKALGVNARTLELFEPSGLNKRLIAAGRKIRRVHLREGMRPLATIDFANLSHRYNFLLVLPQSETERILEDELRRRQVSVEWGSELRSLTQDEAQVTATTRRDGRDRTRRYDYVIGADGPHSTARRVLDIDFVGAAYHGSWSLADLAMEWPFGEGEGNLFISAGGTVLFVMSMGQGRYRAICNAVDVLDLLPETSRVHEILWHTEFRISLRQVETYQRGRVFLAGDAAHVHSPVGGRGMNLGIEDAFVLARMIVEGGVTGYTEARHKVGAEVVRQTDRMLRMVSARNWGGWLLRHAILAPLLKSRWVQRRFLGRLTGLSRR